MKFKIGQLFFWKGTEGLFAKAINYYNLREFGKSECTHVGIISDVLDDKVLIHEAGPDGFVANLYNKEFLEERIEAGIVHIGECKQKLNNVYENCEKYKDIGYGWLDIVGIGLHLLVGWRLLGLTGKNKIICSEAVSRILYDATKSVNLAEEYKIVYDAVTPMHVFNSKWVDII